ncbi:MAG: SDR family NAD(P)-dependent oxidoreductase, partial [Cyanobacteria bacterium P01_E01_bin.34]
ETPLLEVLYGSATDLLNQTAYTQPALFAVEYALAQVWQSWGVQPTAVLGHSLGEYVAACVAGVFSLEAGLKLVAERGRLMQNLPATGGMLAVLAPWEQIQPYWEKAPDALTIAAFNGPSNFVFSGTTSAIDAFAELLEAADIKAKPLLVSHGFHSPLMTPMVEAFRETLATIDYQTPEVPVISNVSGEAIGTEIATADYWCQHILEPVRFAEGMQTLAEMKLSALLEVGPHPVLLGMGRSCMAEDNAAVLGWLPSLRRGQPDWTAMVSAAAELHIKGLSLNWSAVSGGSRRRVELPTYPFQRQRYWVEATSDGSQTEDNGTDNLEPVLQLVQQANLDRLSQQLVESMTLSSHQLQLLPDLLQQLVKLQQQSSLQEDMQGACYRLQWSEQATTFTESQQQQPQNWLILADRQGIGEVIAAHIESQGDCCTLAYAGTGKSLPTGDDTSLVLDPQDTEAFKKLLQDIGAVQRIVYCWGLDIPDTDVLTSPALAQSQAMGCGGLLHMLQAILHSSVTTNPKLCLLTRGAIAVDRTAPQIAQAPLWGLGRVIGLEYPEIWEGCIDLDPAVNTAPLSLSKLLKQPHRDQQLALRDGRLLAARLCKLPLSKESSQILPLSRQATYLITGGLGALGLHIAQGLIDAGVNSLVLLGRSQPSDIAQQQIEQWQQNNIQIQVTQADVADLNQLQAIVQKANQESSPLRGIVHAAGILDDGILLNQQWSQFEKVLRPKVAGAWNLHTLTRDLDLDFFVGFSSAVAILGAPGQGNYAAANLFLNALMEYRQTLGLPGLSLNWGPWQQGGMAAALSNRFAAQGIQSLSASDGVKIFLRLLSSKHSHALVLPIDWSVFQGAATERYPMRLWEDLRPDVPANREDVNADTETLIHELANLPPHQQALRLNATVKAEVAQVLGLKSLDSLEMDKGFADMGMDSLMAVELKSRLETSIGLPLQSTVVFNYPNMEALGAYLSEQLSAYLNERVRQADSETSTVLSTDPYEDLADLEKIKQLSEQDVVSLIAREFAQLC